MRKVFFIAVIIAAVAGATSAAIWWAQPDWFDRSLWWAGAATSTEPSADDRGADDSASSESPSPEESAAPAAASDQSTSEGGESGSYEPTSEYVAEGFDPDERVVDFSEATEGARDGPARDILTSRDVQRMLHERSDRLVPCYQKVLDERPDAQGDVQFSFAIDSGGDVRMVRITDSELRSPAAEDCMVRETRNWEFSKTHLGSVTRFETGMTFRLR